MLSIPPSVLLALGLLLLSNSGRAATIVATNVPATSNIWGAGHAAPSAPGGGGAGTLPIEILIPVQNDGTVLFTNVSGMIDYEPIPPNGAEGIPGPGVAPTNDLDGIAGVQVPQVAFLAGVFLTDAEPSDPAPPQLVIPDIAFSTLSPGIAQSFFIGDGLTGAGSGAVQVFEIPTGATRLFLGFHDAAGGLPGFFGDNTGSISADVVFVPEPGVASLLGLGPALLPWRQRAGRPTRTCSGRTTAHFRQPAETVDPRDAQRLGYFSESASLSAS